ncbi:rubredoxin [Pandoraea faecigallinarum]|uniref:Rubredoxin n=1 Tax=Pandoraea faecigallinarum TaxID=656179 RepID=A0A0H3X120_9BURK|nr:rubredoxin [Pandoraea faecigallinarum]
MAQAAPGLPAAKDASRQWVCVICGWIYDEAAGYPEDGIAPGTRWEDVPEDWRCPLCDVGKEVFAMVEI